MSFSAGHTYGPTCLLHADSNKFTRRASHVAHGCPPMRAQFFYSSSLHIDDPLSQVLAPTTAASRPHQAPPKPFSIHDNSELESHWLELHKEKPSQLEFQSLSPRSVKFRDEGNFPAPDREHDREALPAENILNTPANSHQEPLSSDTLFQNPVLEAIKEVVGSTEPAQSQFQIHEEETSSQPPAAVSYSQLQHSQQSSDHVEPASHLEAIKAEEDTILRKHKTLGPFSRKGRGKKRPENKSLATNTPPRDTSPVESTCSTVASSERPTTGTPFLRLPSRLKHSSSRPFEKSSSLKAPLPRLDCEPTQNQASGSLDGCFSESANDPTSTTSGLPVTTKSSSQNTACPPVKHERSGKDEQQADETQHARIEDQDQDQDPHQDHNKVQEMQSSGEAESLPKKIECKVIVGSARLHSVEMSSLKMGPVYWDPVHDVSNVVRGTWFYKDSMWPVESNLANQLEKGYQYIRPWTLSYVEELNSCLDIGPEAEVKVTQRIWPDSDEGSSSTNLVAETPDQAQSSLEPRSQPRDTGRSMLSGSLSAAETQAAGRLTEASDSSRLFARSSVIYADAREAQILRPSQTPSIARGRRPLMKIRKGQPVGVIVVRGFDYRLWEKLHPPMRSSNASSTAIPRSASFKGRAHSSAGRRKSCSACLSQDERPKVTDLVLVIHGIGQKLSERVESYHFTHAINGFRRQMNVEAKDEGLQSCLSADLGAIMVLPVNWRARVKLEDGIPKSSDNGVDDSTTASGSKSMKNEYTLKDVTAESLPAVRGMISDVMLDIPYYLSHHKSTMIRGVVQEANRIYRLWCANNPDFRENGRVHLVTHSLGSIMALDILSSQPTLISAAPSTLESESPSAQHFEFDTKCLFFCGSPAGFFLLLHHASLIPRRGLKQEIDHDTDLGSMEQVCGDAGTYGCLAVENIYNILHQYDPVAYRLNATVDAAYAENLTPAYVPSISTSWAQYMTSFFKSRQQAHADAALVAMPPNSDKFPHRPSIQQMPSTVEMETHDFTREETAEQRFFLLNDNGQIDFTLKSHGGPLDLQYLNMLSAHSSYWTSQDFVRMLVVEIGRRPGKQHSLTAMRAVKKSWVK